MKEITKRLIVGLISALITLSIVLFAYSPLGIVACSLLVILIGAYGTLEYAGIAEKKNLLLSRTLLVSSATCYLIASLVSAFFIELYFLSGLVFALAVSAFFIHHRSVKGDPLHHISASAFSLIYVAAPLAFALQILYSTYITEDGRLWLLYLIFTVKCSDIFAYFVGKGLGKRPLTAISPKKTKEGLAAAIIGAAVASTAYIILIDHFGFSLRISPVAALFMGALLGLLGQMGDLSESLFKRDAGLKDSARLPGFGGILDMIDSLIFTSPTVYFYIKFTHFI